MRPILMLSGASHCFFASQLACHLYYFVNLGLEALAIGEFLVDLRNKAVLVIIGVGRLVSKYLIEVDTFIIIG